MWNWIERLICAILRLFGITRRRDITVVEDSANDNGYLTGKANRNPGCIRATSNEDMVDKVLRKLWSCDCIRTLKLVGHGSPGNISVGDGQGWESRKHINGNRDEWEAPLSRLRGRFCPQSGGPVLHAGPVGECAGRRRHAHHRGTQGEVPESAASARRQGAGGCRLYGGEPDHAREGGVAIRAGRGSGKVAPRPRRLARHLDARNQHRPSGLAGLRRN